MRRLLTYVLIAACTVKVVPAEYPAHHRAEELVDAATATAWHLGSDAVQYVRETLHERPGPFVVNEQDPALTDLFTPHGVA